MWVSGSLCEEDVEGSAVQAMMQINKDIKPDGVVVAECSSNHIIRGHKGRALIRITVPGKCAHGSEAWRGDNALVKALPVINGIDKLKFTKADPQLGSGTIEVTDCECFAPSHNTIPGKVIVTCDRRIACGESIDDLLSDVRPFIENIAGTTAEIDTEHVKTYREYDITCTDYFPSWVLPEDHPLVDASVKAYEAMFGGEKPVVGVLPCCTNATHFCGRMGIPSIVFGPGELADCHSTNDRVAIKELLKAIKFYAALPLFQQ
jgi:putative selenium metabolism hydrolase